MPTIVQFNSAKNGMAVKCEIRRNYMMNEPFPPPTQLTIRDIVDLRCAIDSLTPTPATQEMITNLDKVILEFTKSITPAQG